MSTILIYLNIFNLLLVLIMAFINKKEAEDHIKTLEELSRVLDEYLKLNKDYQKELKAHKATIEEYDKLLTLYKRKVRKTDGC